MFRHPLLSPLARVVVSTKRFIGQEISHHPVILNAHAFSHPHEWRKPTVTPEFWIEVWCDVDGTVAPPDQGIAALGKNHPELGYVATRAAKKFQAKFEACLAELKAAREAELKNNPSSEPNAEVARFWETSSRINSSQVFVEMFQAARKEGVFRGLTRTTYQAIGKKLAPYPNFSEGLLAIAEQVNSDTNGLVGVVARFISCGPREPMLGMFARLSRPYLRVEVTGQPMAASHETPQKARDSGSKEGHGRRVSRRSTIVRVIGFGDGPTDGDMLRYIAELGGYAQHVHEHPADYEVALKYVETVRSRLSPDVKQRVADPVLADWTEKGAARQVLDGAILRWAHEIHELHQAGESVLATSVTPAHHGHGHVHGLHAEAPPSAGPAVERTLSPV